MTTDKWDAMGLEGNICKAFHFTLLYGSMMSEGKGDYTTQQTDTLLTFSTVKHSSADFDTLGAHLTMAVVTLYL